MTVLSLRHTRRRGFTLLEVALAISLSVILITALYLTLSMHFHYARQGREIVNETQALRAVVDRLNQDISSQLCALDPRPQQAQSGSGGGGSGGSGSGGGGSSGGGSGGSSGGGAMGAGGSAAGGSAGANSSASGATPGGSSGSGSSAGSSSSSSSTQSNAVVFNIGVYGDGSSLVLTGRGVPRDLTQPAQSAPTLTSDLRRVTYWLVRDGGQVRGLARHETTLVTGTEVTASSPPAIPPPGADVDSCIIAPEVKDFTVEYFDGTSWQSSWDGTTQDSTTSNPIGPPMAIAFTITVEVQGHGQEKGRQSTYRHVVAIPAANSTLQQNQGQQGQSTTNS
jgi:prepilin-type N-terminal cleavage/methylation domain-containing protein